MKEKLLVLVMLLVACNNLGAQSFTVGQLTYEVVSEGKHDVAIVGCSEYVTQLVVPSSVVYGDVRYDVIEIGDLAFTRCGNLLELTLPESIVEIGKFVFSGCRLLHHINVSEGNENYMSDNGVLFSKDKSTLLQYPQGKSDTKYVVPDVVETIGEWAFEYCSVLTEVVIPDGVKNIGSYAFSWCSGLTEMNLPSSVVNLGESTFDRCVGLREMVIPDGVTSIGRYAFYECSSLSKITVGNGVKNIGEWAFGECVALEKIELGRSVESMERDVFYNCKALSRIDCAAVTPPVAQINTFQNVNSELSVYVPSNESLEAYKADPYWSIFSDFRVLPTSVCRVDVTRNISVKNGLLYNPNRCFVQIYSMNGSTVYGGTDATVSIPAGIYLVRVGNEVFRQAF